MPKETKTYSLSELGVSREYIRQLRASGKFKPRIHYFFDYKLHEVRYTKKAMEFLKQDK